LDLAAKGVNPTDIAAVVGVHRTTVSDYLRRALPEFEALQAFRDRLGDSFVLSLARLTNLEDKLLTLLDKEDVLATLTPSEKERLLGRVSIAKGIVFDKLRLHEGKSTANNSHEIQLRMVHQEMPTPSVSSGSVRSPSEYIMSHAPKWDQPLNQESSSGR
jgi:hypothetical protein